jgi:hypothetical protein
MKRGEKCSVALSNYKEVDLSPPSALSSPMGTGILLYRWNWVSMCNEKYLGYVLSNDTCCSEPALIGHGKSFNLITGIRMFNPNHISKSLIIFLILILSGCGIFNKSRSNDSAQKTHSDSQTTESSDSSKSLVPPGFGETPRNPGGYNPINPAGAGAGY